MRTKELIKSIKQKREFIEWVSKKRIITAELLNSVEPRFSIEWVKKTILGI